MSSLHTRTATFASLKCRSKCDFWDKLRKSQKKGKRAVFPYDKASSRKPCLSLSSSIGAVTTSTVRQKQTAPIESLPSQSNCSKQIITENKKQQANLACCFFLLFARCILISYSVDLSSSNSNSFSNHTN